MSSCWAGGTAILDPESKRRLEFLFSDISRWTPGPTVRVAFFDGDCLLHVDIAGATAQITDACNFVLDFGLDNASGVYEGGRPPTPILPLRVRVSLDVSGYFSSSALTAQIGPSGHRAARSGATPANGASISGVTL
ncbi:MAG: hypothetical protein JWM31_3744 [Solirubrobacterales bacterium]|nr:hypothetical protein [Solirubrobacterales bacterium]